MGKKRFHSPTSINTYRRCPRKYFYRYIKKMQCKPSIHLIKGLAVHKALAEFYGQDMGPDSEVSALRTSLLDLFSKAWEERRGMLNNLGLGRPEIDRHYTQAVQMLYGWFFRFMEKASLGIRKPKTEVKLFSGKHGLMGFIDAVYEQDGKVVLVDYKTSAKDDVTIDIRVQMAIYALLYEENFGVRPKSVVIDFLATGNKETFFVDQAMIDWAEEICRDVAAKTVSEDIDDYPCTCGGMCKRDFIWEDEI